MMTMRHACMKMQHVHASTVTPFNFLHGRFVHVIIAVPHLPVAVVLHLFVVIDRPMVDNVRSGALRSAHHLSRLVVVRLLRIAMVDQSLRGART